MKFKPALACLAGGFLTLGAVATSAALWLCIFGLAGVALVVTGVFMLAGTAWALIFVGVVCMLLALLLIRGMNRAQ